ncbi:ras-related protein Rab-38 isoform X1 [Diorhabda carinulata]|uniref:ras-related protein Rab-38 isoform X1 n=1 Tax=Diorhabda carinulata TaxID=1163345 RepID=UPI0025A149B2|nr:ras-related protein Rab-38 isoform X1 [Diorhabda carinulata]
MKSDTENDNKNKKGNEKKLTSKVTATEEIEKISTVPQSSVSSNERQTPEDNNHLTLTRSVSDTNLQESWKSAEKSVKIVTRSQSIGGEFQQETERTKYLRNFKGMAPYGELIIEQDPNTSSASQSTSKPKDGLYKILVIGDLGTGKTSIIKRYVHRFFTQHYRATIGVDFALKVLNWDENTVIRLQLWDIAGQERYGNMTRVYYKEAVAAFIVFDVTRRATFDSVGNWKTDLDTKVQLPDGSKIPCVLLANKCDQPKEGIVNNPAKMDEFCKENGFHAWFETSAKDNINIDDAANSLVEKILANDSLLNSESRMSADQFALGRGNNEDGLNRNKCSC